MLLFLFLIKWVFHIIVVLVWQVVQKNISCKQKNKLNIDKRFLFFLRFFGYGYCIESTNWRLRIVEKMYFKKLVKLQIFYIDKFLIYVILCHRVHIWWPSILFQSCHGKRSGYMHASHTTLFEISSHDSWFWRGLNDQYV